MTGGSWQIQTTLNLTGQQLLPNAPAPLAQSLNLSSTQKLPYGTGAGTVSIVVAQAIQIVPGGSVTLNLFSGALLDITGIAAPFRLLRAYAVWIAAGGDANGVTIGNAGSNPHPLFFGSSSSTKTIYPNGPEDAGGNGVSGGVPVTSSAANVLIVNNSATAFVTVVATFAGTQGVSGASAGGFPMTTYP